MPVILKNNAFSTLATGITTSDTGIVVASGSQFPAITAGEYFYATLVSQAGTTEIIKVTARVGNSMTVVRAQDGSTAASFQAGTLVEMRVNAASMTDLVDEHDQASEISIADAGNYYTSGVVEGALQEAMTRANLSASSGSSLVGYNQGGTGAVTRTVQGRLRDSISVKDFGATGDGVTDDTAAIQAAVDYLTDYNGGTLHIPYGLYKVTATINIGLPQLTSFSFITTRTSELGDPEILANTSIANRIANQSKSHVDIQFAPGATLVASWSPTVPEPVLSYNIQEDGSATSTGTINNASIVSAVMIVNGVYKLDAVSTPQSNNLIAIYVSRGCRRVIKPFISGVEHGIISLAGFWTRITDVYMWRGAGICLNIALGNAMKIDNLSLWYSGKGVVFDGDATEISGIHTQQVAEDLIVFACDCCVFGPGYLEDVSGIDGSSKYAVTLGYVQNGIKIKSSTFRGLRVGSVRPNKGAFRIWDTRNSTLDICRSYSNSVVFDTQSRGLINQCDFESPSTNRQNWVVVRNALVYASSSPTGSNYVVQGPWMLNVLGITTASIAPGDVATYDYTLPSELNTITAATVNFTFTSGGPVQLVVSARIIGPAPNRVRFWFYNPTSGALTVEGANLTMTIFAAI